MVNEELKAAAKLADAAQNIFDQMVDTYRARNGRHVGIEDDGGEKCWIVPSDDIERLRGAMEECRLASLTPPQANDEAVEAVARVGDCPNCDMPLGRDGGCYYPECDSPRQPDAPDREGLAKDISRIAGCQVGSERTRKIVDYILSRDARATIEAMQLQSGGVK